MRSLTPSDRKSAESVHPNLTRAPVGGEQQEDGHADAQTRGPGECSLNVSVTLTMQVAEMLCQHFESAGQRKWEKVTREEGLRGQGSRMRTRGRSKKD